MSAADPRALAQKLIGLVDLTELGDACRTADVSTLARIGRDRVAALCVWPQFIGEAKRALGSATTAIATVINFPDGGEDVERAVADAREAVRDGASEIDLVLPWRAILAGRDAVAREMVSAVRASLPDHIVLKVILETGALAQPALIARAASVAIGAGANFLKTSTGKASVGVSIQAARVVLETIAKSGKAVGFKASGGVRTAEAAAAYLALAEEIMGSGWASRSTFRIGASLLLGELERLAGVAKK